MTAYDRLVDALRDHGSTVKDTGAGKAQAQCPAHDDGTASLSVTRIEGSVLLYCHASCATDDVLDALKLTRRDLFDEPRGATYEYPDGRRVHRTPDKRFRQSGNTSGNQLFRADRVKDAELVYVVEGEKDVYAVEAAGAAAVTTAGGAGKAHKFDWTPLAGKDIVVVTDDDVPGRRHAQQTVAMLKPVAKSVSVVASAVGKDAADHIAAGLPLNEMVPVEPADHPVDGAEPQRGRQQVPSPAAPLDVARTVYQAHRDADGTRTLVAWRNGWMRWFGPHWADMDTAELRSELYKFLGAVDYLKPITVNGHVVDHEPTPWNPDKRKIANVMEAMGAVGHLNADLDPPAWIGLHSAAHHPAGQMIGCANGILNLTTREVHPHTPALFNTVSVPFDYDPDAAEPVTWLQFLSSVWPNDQQPIALLQEYIGYVLSGRTDMQKMLLLIGPTRSGKGTIARMLAELVGRGHVAGPTLASLGTNFGLSPLLGKPLAIISDARLGNAPADAVVERLLSITGEDTLTVDRKFKDPWSGKLSTRFVILSNELPKFRDASGAIANRLVILQMTESFLGREDRSLDRRLRNELPGILTWALQGLDRLVRTGRFTVPSSSDDATNLMMDLASPVSAFIRERCRRGPSEEVTTDGLYDAWKVWAEDNGHRSGAKSTFGRDIRAVVPEVKVTQPRIAGRQARYYTGIALLPVSPVSVNGTTGQGHDDDTSDDAPIPCQSPRQNQRTPTDTGNPPPGAAEKPQVNGADTGDTGKSAFKPEHSAKPIRVDGPDRCPSCGFHTPTQGHRDTCPANTEKENERP